MPNDPHRELSDEDIRKMAREAEALAARHEAHQKPRGVHLRRASILLGLVAVSDMTVEEIVWHLREVRSRAPD